MNNVKEQSRQVLIDYAKMLNTAYAIKIVKNIKKMV